MQMVRGERQAEDKAADRIAQVDSPISMLSDDTNRVADVRRHLVS